MFLGNAAYPDPFEYDAFITSHGGHSNAFTDSEKTVYYSSVSYEGFPEGLQRMMHMFAEPNFDLGDVSKEVMAVDSEHEIHHSDPTWRVLNALGTLQAPPANQFTTGNNETLGNYTDVVARLNTFFKSHYCPSRLSLVTYGPFDSFAQIAFAQQLFAEIETRAPSGCAAPANYAAESPLLAHGPIPKSNLNKILRIAAPASSEAVVWLNFPMRFSKRYYHAQPLSYLELVITFKGEGGLTDSLVKAGYITGIEFLTDTTSAGLVAYLVIHLTKRGFQNRDTVIADVLGYLRQLAALGVSQQLYEGMARISEATFQALEKSSASPMDIVKDLAADLAEGIPAEELLSSKYLVDVPELSLVQAMLDKLSIENLVVAVYEPGYIPTGANTQSNVYYEFDYTVEEITSDQLDLWDNSTSLYATIHSFGYLPPRITAVAHAFPVTWADVGVLPVLLYSEPTIEVWVRKSVMYPDLPKGSIFFAINFNAAQLDVSSETFARLFRRVVATQVNVDSADLLLAGNAFEINWLRTGFEIVVSGWKQHIPILLQSILTAMGQTQWECYQRTLNNLVNLLAVSGESKLIDLAIDDIDALSVLQPTSADVFSRLESSPTQADVSSWFQSMLGTSYVTTYFTGLFTDAEAISFSLAAVAKLATKPKGKLDESTFYYAGPKFIKQVEVRRRSPVANTSNAAYLVAFSLPPSSTFSQRFCLSLIGQMLEPRMFAVLRTEKQLGYIASTSVGLQPGPAGALQLRVGVQGNNVSPDVIDYWVEKVLSDFSNDLASFTSDKLDPWIASLVSALSQLPGNRESETRRFWPVLRDHTDCFTRREQQIEYLTKTDFKQLLPDLQATLFALTGPSRSKIVSKIFPHGESAIPEMIAAKGAINGTNENFDAWVALGAGAYVINDSTRSSVEQALLSACDSLERSWKPEIPICPRIGN